MRAPDTDGNLTFKILRTMLAPRGWYTSAETSRTLVCDAGALELYCLIDGGVVFDFIDPWHGTKAEVKATTTSFGLIVHMAEDIRNTIDLVRTHKV